MAMKVFIIGISILLGMFLTSPVTLAEGDYGQPDYEETDMEDMESEYDISQGGSQSDLQKDTDDEFAQDEDNESQEVIDEEYLSYGYGTVVTVSASLNTITISEFDWDDNMDKNVVYKVEPGVQVEGISSWKDIKKDYYLDIEYVEDPIGNRIAKYISVYEYEPASFEELSDE